jgi:hypothetical protein
MSFYIVQVSAQEGACAGVVHGVPGVPCSLPAQPGGAAVGAAVSAVCSRMVLARAGRRAAALPRRHVCGECHPLPVPAVLLNQRELLRSRKKADLRQFYLPVLLSLQSQRVKEAAGARAYSALESSFSSVLLYQT